MSKKKSLEVAPTEDEVILGMAHDRIQGPMGQIDLDDEDRLKRGVSCGFRHASKVFVAHLTWKREKTQYEFLLEVLSLNPDQSKDAPPLNLEATRSFTQKVTK